MVILFDLGSWFIVQNARELAFILSWFVVWALLLSFFAAGWWYGRRQRKDATCRCVIVHDPRFFSSHDFDQRVKEWASELSPN